MKIKGEIDLNGVKYVPVEMTKGEIKVDGVTYVPLDDYKSRKKELEAELKGKLDSLKLSIENREIHLKELENRISFYEDERTARKFEERCIVEILRSFKASDNEILHDVVAEAERVAHEIFDNKCWHVYPWGEFKDFVEKYLDKYDWSIRTSWQLGEELESENRRLKRENTALRKERGFITKTEKNALTKAVKVINTIMERTKENEEAE